MLVINILMFLTMVVLLLCYMMCFVNGAQANREPQKRTCDLIAGTLLVLLFVFLIKVYLIINGGIV